MMFLVCMLAGGLTACGPQVDPEPCTTENEVLDGTHMDKNMVEAEKECENRPVAKQTVDLTENVPKPEFEIGYTTELPLTPILRFGWEVLQESVKQTEQGENVLVSPLSAFTALQMAMIGADGETREQMEEVLRTPLNFYVVDCARGLPSGNGFTFNMANSIWYKDDGALMVKEPFLQFNIDAFDTDIFMAPFDEGTLRDINHWVSNKTDGKIENILNEIPEEAVVYLINALSFDAEWESVYKETEVWKDIFLKEDGTEQLVEMLHSEENSYLENESATGFVKYYKGKNYAFVALLPKEGMSVADYVQKLTGEEIAELLNSQQNTSVQVTMPKFSTEYSVELKDILAKMGMPDAFDMDKADFTLMAESQKGNIYINKVLQKTFLSVDERGTSAGAATVVEMANKMALLNRKEVILNRPFVYMVVECEYNEPLFIGTMMDVKK